MGVLLAWTFSARCVADMEAMSFANGQLDEHVKAHMHQRQIGG